MEDRQVGEYFISESQIGSGSFSKVYLAKDRAGRKAAVKIIKKTSKTSEHIKLAQR